MLIANQYHQKKIYFWISKLSTICKYKAGQLQSLGSFYKQWSPFVNYKNTFKATNLESPILEVL